MVAALTLASREARSLRWLRSRATGAGAAPTIDGRRNDRRLEVGAEAVAEAAVTARIDE